MSERPRLISEEEEKLCMDMRRTGFSDHFMDGETHVFRTEFADLFTGEVKEFCDYRVSKEFFEAMGEDACFKMAIIANFRRWYQVIKSGGATPDNNGYGTSDG